MVASAAALIGAHGVNATSFSDVLDDSGAPRGSIYHHFPGGKRQLAEDAMAWTREQVLAYQRSCRATSAPGVVEHFVALFRQAMVASECRAGCPVAGVIVDTYSGEDGLLKVGRESFRSWIGLLSRQLVNTGVPPKAARSLAMTTLASVEGALVLCRAEGTVRPLDSVEHQLSDLARSLVGPRAAPRAASTIRVRRTRGSPPGPSARTPRTGTTA